jgi:NADPH-dependent methylglyoxal reductase
MPVYEPLTTNSVVLVTGANGHIAQHVVDQLLHAPKAHQAKVRGTVRSDSSLTMLSKHWEAEVEAGLLELMRVPDITNSKAFGTALAGVTHIIHIASPFVVGSNNVEQDVLVPAVRGTTAILTAALSSPTVKSVVVTSSIGAVLDALHGARPGHTYTIADWNPTTWDEAADPNLDLSVYPPLYRGYVTYMASKKLAEKAAWDLYSEQRPKWRLAMINPSGVGGPYVVPPANGSKGLSTSLNIIWSAASSKPGEKLLDLDWVCWVDVRDVAEAHINALTIPDASGQRFILAPHRVTYSDMARIARERCGMDASMDQQVIDHWDMSSLDAERVLGIREWRDFETMIVETIEQVKQADGL